MFLDRFRHLKQPKLSLRDVLDKGQDHVCVSSDGGYNNRAYNYIVLGNRLDEVEAELASNGVTKFDYVGAGDNAILARFAPTRLLRFRGGSEANWPGTWDTVDCPYCIKPFYFVDKGWKIVGVPELTPLSEVIAQGRIQASQAELLIESLRVTAAQNGLYIYDYKVGGRVKYEQFGLLKDGTPVIIDMGSIVNAPTYFEKLSESAQDNTIAQNKLERELKDYEALRSKDTHTPQGHKWDGSWHTAEGVEKVLADYPECKKFAETKINPHLGSMTQEMRYGFRVK